MMIKEIIRLLKKEGYSNYTIVAFSYSSDEAIKKFRDDVEYTLDDVTKSLHLIMLNRRGEFTYVLPFHISKVAKMTNIKLKFIIECGYRRFDEFKEDEIPVLHEKIGGISLYTRFCFKIT